MNKKIKVKDTDITIIEFGNTEYVSLTDIVKKTEGDQLIKNWMKNKNTIEFLGVWERLNNPNFNMVEFDLIRLEAGTNRFLLSANQWIEKTGAIGIMAKAGRYGGTYAHKDLALEFCTWISPEFKFLVLKEFQRLKEQEAKLINTEWDYKRFLSKVNYRLHTDAIKENVIPKYGHLTKDEEHYIYADEAEMLNVAVFGITSKKWRLENSKAVLDGHNIRNLANIPQLTVLTNLEALNSYLIKEGLSGKERFEKLKVAAISQLKSLSEIKYTYPLESPHQINYRETSTLDRNLKGLLNVPPPQKDNGEQ